MAACVWDPVDAGCMALLLWLTRREGLRLFDLVGFDSNRLGRDVLLGLALIPPRFAAATIDAVRDCACVDGWSERADWRASAAFKGMTRDMSVLCVCLRASAFQFNIY